MFDVNKSDCAELSGKVTVMQGQDESEETKCTLESCNAIGGAIEFTSVSIDPIKVLITNFEAYIYYGSHPTLYWGIVALLHLYQLAFRHA